MRDDNKSANEIDRRGTVVPEMQGQQLSLDDELKELLAEEKRVEFE